MSYEGGGGNASAWSTFPATQNVTVTGYNLDVDTITGLGGNMVTLSAVTGMDGSNFLTLDGNIITGSQILYGSIPPGLTAGAANDTYINTTNGDVYSKVSSTEWIPTSSQSLPWTSVASDSTGQFLAACVQNQKIWRSDNAGGIWVETDAPSAYWTSIASDSSGAKLVACVSGGKIWTSINYGLTWSESDSVTGAWSSVASSSNGQVLLACVEGSTIYVSLDSGANWIESDAPFLAWTSIACNSSATLCVACASGGKIWTSIDGQSWTETTSPTSNWRSVTSSSGQFLLACVSYGTIWRSVDGGVNWTETSSPPQEWSSVKCTPDETKLIACSQGGGIWTSIDAGGTWVESDAPTSIIWTSVTCNSTGTKLFASASGEPIYTNSGGWALELNITGPTGSAGATGATGATGPAGPTGSAPQVYQATYYKSSAQNLTSGNTDITFGLTGSWNNPGTYIAQTAPTDFTVGITGLYQMEFNVFVNANGASWNSLTNKNAAITVTRGASEQAVIANTALQAHAGGGGGGAGVGVNYAQCVSGTYYLHASDVINLRIANTFTGGPPSAEGLLNTFDLNTFFTWRFIS